GTSLLTSTYQPAEKAKVQAINDLIIFATAAFASLSSGLLHYLIGWQAVNLSMIAPVVAALCAILWLRHRRDRAPA
ncbi:MAG: MFS transporter, partial [Alphaproteobacteria bacterium]|nr:MFS transporter [Alphaproteobacteria bacterium]